MADIQSNIDIRIDTSSALASIKLLQAQISAFHTSMAKGTTENVVASKQLQQKLIDSINATQKFSAGIQNIKTTTESFTAALEKNKLSLAQYFKYSIAATKSFGGTFKTEMSTIDKVARERVKDLQTQYIQLGRDANGAMKAIAVRPLVLDLENLQTKTALVAQKQQILNQLLKQGSTNLLNFGKNTQWAGRQLMVGFTIPLSMAATAAAKAYMDIEKASVAIARVYGDLNTSNKEVTTMVAQIKQLAGEYTKYGIAISDTMAMAAKAAAMGKTGADLLAQVNQASKLAALGMVDQSQALDTTISLTNAFGTSVEQLSNKINFLNAVENQTVLSIEDMTVAIPKAAPIVKQLGGDVEDLAFFLTAMKEGGINASEGANALKSGLSSLINPTKASSEFLAGFGVNVKKIVEDDKGNLKKTVVDFASALDKIDPLNRARAIEMMFGKFQFSRISTLLQNVNKEGSQASKALELANMSSIQLAAISRKELDKLQSSPMYKFQKSIADLQLKIAPIGETFLKAVTPIIEKVGDFLNGFNKMGDGFKQFTVVGAAILGGLAPVLLMVIGLVANGAANIIKMFANVKAFLNKTTTESQVLGETTSYLTTEQIKAEAVAASLDQTHTKLKQTMTSETSAVIALMEAYQAANAAMAGFRVPAMPTSIGRGKKLATGGIISGPGTGTSDSIPAMLSDGEAVIPAKHVAQNRSLVEGLVRGNLPGFANGGIIGRIVGGMLNRSRVSTRMSSNILLQMLASGDTRYRNAFETNTGADFLSGRYMGPGVINQKAKNNRSQVESMALGIGALTSPEGRPTYGAATTTSPIARILNIILGGKRGREFNRLTSPMNPRLDQYGDISLIGKRSLGQRSQIYAGDLLSDYVRGRSHFLYRHQKGIQFPSMYGATSEDIGGIASNRLGEQLAGSGLIPYIEAYTKGGFDLNELSQILVRKPELVPQIEAALAQAGLNIPVKGPHTGFLKKIFGYASGGIISGSGSGTSDSIPAMVSNGEAIIPAKNVARFPGLVKGLVSGNIPGFANGKPPTQFAHVNEKSVMISAGDLYDALLKAEGEGKKVSLKLKNQLAGIVTDIGRDFKVRGYSGLGFSQDYKLNTGMRQGGAVSTEEFLKDFEQRGVSKWNKSIKLGGGNLKDAQLQEHLKEYDSAIISGIAEFKKLSNGSKITSDQFAAIEKQARLSIPEFSQLRQALDSAESGLFEVRSNITQSTLAGTGLKLEKLPSSTGKGFSEKYTGRFSTGTYFRTGGNRVSKESAGSILGLLLSDFENGLSQAAQTKSPSKRTGKIAKDTVDGYANELEGGKKKVAATAKKTTQAESDAILRNLQIRKQQAEMMGADTAAIEKEIVTRRNQIAATKQAIVEEQQLAIQRNVGMQYDKPIGPERPGLISRAGSKVSGFIANSGTGKLAGLAFGASMAASALSMIPGPVGQIVGQFTPWINGISMLLPVLSMLPAGVMGALAPLTPWILGIGAVVAGTTFLIGQANEARKKELEKINTTSAAYDAANKSIGALSNILGQTPKKSGYEFAQGNILGQSAKITNDVQTLLQTDAFKPDGELSNLADKFSKIESKKDRSTFLTSYATMLSGKGIAEQEINSLIAAIQQKAKKTDITFDFKSIKIGTSGGNAAMNTAMGTLFNNVNKAAQPYFNARVAAYAFNLKGQQAFIDESDPYSKNTQQRKAAVTKATELDLKNNKEKLAYVNALKTGAESTKNFMQGISDAFINGQISQKGYDRGISLIRKNINNLSTDSAKLGILKNVFSGMSPEIQAVANQISTVAGKVAYLQSVMLGLGSISQQDIYNLNNVADHYEGTTLVKGDPKKAEQTRKKIVDAAKKQAADIKKVNDEIYGTGNNGGGGNTKLDPFGDFFKNLEEKKKSVAAELMLRKELLATGLDIADAERLAADSAAQQAYLAANTADKKAKIIAGLRTQLSLEKQLKTVEEVAAEKAKKAVDEQQKKIDLKKAQLKIPEQQAQINQYNDALNVLGSQETAINKTYDERSAALEKIQKYQEGISAAQKDQLTVADALSKGDIAAAAKAAQDARANAAQKSLDNQKTQLDNARQQQLDALTVSVNGKLMTRKQIELQIETIQARINKLQLDEISAMEISLAQLQEASTVADQAATTTATPQNGGKVVSVPTTAPTKGSPQRYSSWVAAGSPDPKRSPSRFAAWANKVAGFSMGGVIPKYFATGGFALGTDTVPAMLTPGEFVVSQPAVRNFGVDRLRAINNGTSIGDSVYNYTLSVNMSGSNLNPNDVAKAVMTQIRQVDAQRIRGNTF